MEDEVIKKFGNRLRIRVSGILIENDKILMILHEPMGETGIFWAPPGGGIKFGQSIQDNLKREFMEETGLEIGIKKYLFINEFLNPPFHAIEVFFEVKKTGGKLYTGKDPEMNKNGQIIKKTEFMGSRELAHLGKNQVHSIFSTISKPTDVLLLKGIFNNGTEANFK